MTKSIKTAYVLWLFGGIFGLHHFYLRRDKQAFIYLTSLGGLLIGFLRDIYRLPEYVREANEDQTYVQNLQKIQSQLKTPVFMTPRFVASLAVGSLVGYVSRNCIKITDHETDYFLVESLAKFLSPIFVTIVVYFIGTEGPIKCNFKWPLIGSYIAFSIDSMRNVSSIINASLLSALLLNWNLEWDLEYFENRKKRSLKKRVFYFIIGLCIFSSIASLFVWNNATLEVDGEKLTIKQYLERFYNSPEMIKLREVFEMLWNFYKAHGLKRLIHHFYYGYDPESISNAYKVLELNERSTQQDIDQKCRLLSRKWHPDKYKDAEKKLQAEKTFMSVQESCNILSEHRKNKIDKNKKDDL